MLRIPYKDHGDRPSKLRWWLGDQSKNARYLGAWRFLLPLTVLLLIPIIIYILAANNGPFVVAIVLFSPIASLLILVAITLVLATVSGAKKYLKDVATGIAIRGSCPACGYPLGESLPDQLCTCPECGGQWNATPVVHSIVTLQTAEFAVRK